MLNTKISLIVQHLSNVLDTMKVAKTNRRTKLNKRIYCFTVVYYVGIQEETYTTRNVNVFYGPLINISINEMSSLSCNSKNNFHDSIC